jgi:hypothetical protein
MEQDLDEVLSENDFSGKSASSPQTDLIHQYCAPIDERIRTAKTKEDGRRILEETCQSFEGNCASDILRSALSRHVTAIFERYWGAM